MERRNLDIISGVVIASATLLVFALVMCRIVAPSISGKIDPGSASVTDGTQSNRETNDGAKNTTAGSQTSGPNEAREPNGEHDQGQNESNHISNWLLAANFIMAFATC